MHSDQFMYFSTILHYPKLVLCVAWIPAASRGVCFLHKPAPPVSLRAPGAVLVPAPAPSRPSTNASRRPPTPPDVSSHPSPVFDPLQSTLPSHFPIFSSPGSRTPSNVLMHAVFRKATLPFPSQSLSLPEPPSLSCYATSPTSNLRAIPQPAAATSSARAAYGRHCLKSQPPSL